MSYRHVFSVQARFWGSVFVVHSDGQIDDLTPQQAVADARLIGSDLMQHSPADLTGKLL